MSEQATAAIERFAQTWSAWMVEMSLHVAVLAAAVGLLAWGFGRRSASFRYALWLVVLVRLAVPPWLALPTGWGWWVRSEPAPVVTAAERAAPQQLPPMARHPDAGRIETSFIPQESAASTPPPSPVEVAAGPQASPPQAPPQPEIASAPLQAPSWAALLMIGWAGVSLTLLGLLVLGGVRTRRWVRQASPTPDERLARILDRCRRRLNVDREIGLRNSESCTTPLVVGWRRPVILLPACVPQQLEDDELEAVILHELNHVVRHDALVNFAQAVLAAIYFFHPLVWWANAQLHRLREDACDELTVAALEGRRRAYGSALVKVSTILGYAAPPLALGVMESPHPARRRLGRILDPNLPLGKRPGWQAVAAGLLLAMVFLPAGPRPSPTLAEDRSVAAKPTTEVAAGAEQPVDEPTTPPAPADADEPREPASEPASEASPPPELRYRWRPGQSVAYSIHIEADDAEGIETRQGNLTYAVRSADDGRAVLAVHGALHGFRRPHPGAMYRGGPPSFDFFPSLDDRLRGGFLQERTLTVDDRGRVLAARGSSPLPFALGDLAQLVLLTLPAAGEREWRRSTPARIELAERRDDRFPRSPFLRPTPEVLEAAESNEFRLASWNDAEAVIHQQMQLASVDRIGDKPRMEASGEGDAVFDVAGRVVSSLDWRLKIVTRDEHLSRTTNVTVTCRRLAPREPAPAPVEPDLPQTLAELDDEAPETMLAALRRLRQWEPNEQRAVVAARLEALLDHPEVDIREAAASAFAFWAGEEDAATLIALLEEDSPETRVAAMEALGRLQVAAAIEPIVRRLHASGDRIAATQALTAIGPACEEAVLKLLESDAWSLRLAAVNLLRDVGGPASLPPLKSLRESDPHNTVRTWAELAVESIENRLAPK
jgi:beta-lactamase regulating signal transducer with metallopeptidase domain